MASSAHEALTTTAEGALPPPPLSRVAGELSRLLVEYGSFRTVARFLPAQPGDGRPVLVLPGLLAGDGTTSRLRRQLRQRRYWVHGWGLGRNYGFTDSILDKLPVRLAEIAERHGAPVTVIGWSAGGLLARWLAHEHSEHVRHVITLGAPIHFDLTRTRAATVAVLALTARRYPTSERAVEVLRRQREPLKVPLSAIYSRFDALLNWQVCVEEGGPRSENVSIPSSHMGFCFNLAVLLVVLDRLSLPEDTWRPFEPGRALRRLPSVSG